MRRRLDRAGYSDGDGFRLGPDGKRIYFAVIAENTEPPWVDALQLISGYCKDVGIDMRPKVEGRSLVFARQEANKQDAIALTGIKGLRNAMLYPNKYMPGEGCPFAQLWGEWYGSGGKSGEKPPAAPRRQMELYDRLKTSPGAKDRVRLFKEILQISQERVLRARHVPAGHEVSGRPGELPQRPRPDAGS